jgi:hypothetical protein
MQTTLGKPTLVELLAPVAQMLLMVVELPVMLDLGTSLEAALSVLSGLVTTAHIHQQIQEIYK